MKGLHQFATRTIDEDAGEEAALLRHLHRGRSEGSRPRSTPCATSSTSSRPNARPAATGCSIWRRRRTPSRRSRKQLGRTGLLRRERLMAAPRHRKAVRHRSRLGQGAEPRTAASSSTSTRSTGSITISARRRCRTSWCCASPTACSSRSGTATTSTTCRSRSPRSSASAIAAASTTRPARCATWCRTICSSCCRWSRWSRPSRFDAHAVRSEKAEVLDAIQLQSEEEALQEFGARAISRRQGRRHRDRDYRKTADVKPGSTTETYVALKLTIDNWRWAGVPFYLRTGKALGVKRTESRDQVQAGAVRDVPRHAGRRAGRRTIW